MIHKNTGRPGFGRRMSRNEINACPLECWNGAVSVVQTMGDLDVAIRKLEGHTLLGFDTETRPAYKKGETYPPSLLQLASDDEVFIFQLKYFGLVKPLYDILANPDILKVGVGLEYDILELKKMVSFEAVGFKELACLARDMGIKNYGLRGLAAVLLGFRISKGAKTSNWAKDVLTPQQIQYAATDAWVGRRLYQAIKHEMGMHLL